MGKYTDEFMAALEDMEEEGLGRAVSALCNALISEEISAEQCEQLQSILEINVNMHSREVEAEKDRVMMRILERVLKVVEGRIARIESVLDQIWAKLKD